MPTGLRNSANTSRQRRVIFQPTLDRLVAVRHAAQATACGSHFADMKCLRSNSGASSLTRIFVSKSSPAEKLEVLVGRPSIAINAAVLAAAVGVQVVSERDVRAVVLGEDRLTGVAKEQGSRARVFGRVVLRQRHPPREWLEAVGRILRRPTTPNGWKRCSEHSITIPQAIRDAILFRPPLKWCSVKSVTHFPIGSPSSKCCNARSVTHYPESV